MKRAITTPLFAALLFALAFPAIGEPEDEAMADRSASIDSLWDYWDPSGTRVKFENALTAAKARGDNASSLELQTQIARTFGLENEFDRAHALLDTVEASLAGAPEVVRVRYLLERGRAFRSSGNVSVSESLFVEAFELGRSIGTDFYTIDAAHMVAIAANDRDDKQKWNFTGVELAEKSSDARARSWLGSLYNNIGWDYHDHTEYDKALEAFEKALTSRLKQGEPKRIGIAKWCVARGLRSLERIDEALVIQLALEAEYDSTGNTDAYVYEELGELYLLTGNEQQSQEYFALAYAELSKQDWFVQGEAARLKRLKTLGKVDSIDIE